MENRSIQEDEIESLQAIYGEDFNLLAADSAGSYVFSIGVSSPDSRQSIDMQITYPEGYPTVCAPVYELRNSEWLEDTDIQYIAERLSQIYKDNESEVVVYQWIECIREYINTHCLPTHSRAGTAEVTTREDDDTTTVEGDTSTHTQPSTSVSGSTGYMAESHFSSKTHRHEMQAADSSRLCGGEAKCPVIVHGEPLTDRKSTFQAHAAVINTRQEVGIVVAELKKNKKIDSATHNILAYRLLDSRKGVLVQDCDDDGESAAGGRLLHLLQMMNATNVIVVVSRWYGGIQLHGDRFKHINNVARTLLQETGVGLEHKEGSLAKSARTKGKRTKH